MSSDEPALAGPPVSELVAGVQAGNRALLGQAITLIESTHPQHRKQARELLAALLPAGSQPTADSQTRPVATSAASAANAASAGDTADAAAGDPGSAAAGDPGGAEPLGAIRVGISGAPGVGKSTFIEALGTLLTGTGLTNTGQTDTAPNDPTSNDTVPNTAPNTASTSQGKRVAVLAVDPSSERTGGSIMGDKTRMTELSNNPQAFVRPSPTSGQLGGVHARTRETILLCEAAGFDVVLVETVGVGQSETAVADMVDFFLVLMQPGAGDDLQGIKKGIMELADMIAINKADGDDVLRAEHTANSYRRALHLTEPISANWTSPVVKCSALTGEGLADVWAEIERHHKLFVRSGELAERRQAQRVRWLRALLTSQLLERFHTHPSVAQMLPQLEADVAANRITPTLAAEQLLEVFAG